MSVLHLSRKLYTRRAINETVEAFGELANIALTVDGAYYRVAFDEVDPDVAPVIDREFANYALAATIDGNRER